MVRQPLRLDIGPKRLQSATPISDLPVRELDLGSLPLPGRPPLGAECPRGTLVPLEVAEHGRVAGPARFGDALLDPSHGSPPKIVCGHSAGRARIHWRTTPDHSGHEIVPLTCSLAEDGVVARSRSGALDLADTEEVTGSSPVSPTEISPGQGHFPPLRARRHTPQVSYGRRVRAADQRCRSKLLPDYRTSLLVLFGGIRGMTQGHGLWEAQCPR
jgi:hypothetical protein